MDNMHFSKLISYQSAKYKDKVVFNQRKTIQSDWEQMSWEQMESDVISLSRQFLASGVEVQARIGQFSNNLTENLIVDFALFSIRGVVVPMYATSTAAQIEYIVKDASIEILFVGNQTQYAIALEAQKSCPTLKTIIVFDQDVVLHSSDDCYYADYLQSGRKLNASEEYKIRQKDASLDDMACILYTSGTTGNPKGVVLVHNNLTSAVRIHYKRLTSISDTDTSIAFLPLSHIFERMWTYYCLSKGVEIFINLNPIEVTETIKDVNPTLMCAVPRFWEKVYAGVQEKINEMSPVQQAIVTWALATGKRYNINTLRLGKKPDIFLQAQYKIADKLIFSKVKNTLGIQNGQMFPVAGAKLSDEINQFMHCMGVPITYGYGLTESTATVCCFDYTHYTIGSVGKIMPEVEVKIGEENEILLRGNTIFPGYYNQPEINKAAFTADGWFKTGDAGYIEDDILYLTDRIKDLFKTSYGKYIAPQEIETRLVLDKYIEQVAVIGDEKPYVTALIVPDYAALEKFATKQMIHFTTREELLENETIQELIRIRIDKAQQGMANYEMVKKFTLLEQPFSIQTGELTNTLKLKRVIVNHQYKLQIDKMY